jgi:tetratricopeptide (TPR) repeat protein
LDLAVASLEKSVDLADSSAPSYAAKVYGLAQAQSRMGFQAEAAASYEKLGKIQQSRFSRLSIEYLRICEVMEKDSKDYQAAIERALADSRDRGDNDNYEPVLRHLLGLSYRNTKQYVKSTETLKAHLEKRGDLSAHDMLLIAWNTRDSKDIPGAQKVLEEVVAKYPKTGEGETAQGELRRLIYQPLPPEEVTAQRPRRGVLIGANLAAITILVAIFVRRQVKNKSSQRNCS